jgi:hypothetical protein
VWCEDARTGEIIHLGGEFTWGDCREVAERFRALISAGILPGGGEAWEAVEPKLVFISDGAEWVTEHVLPLFSEVEVILDPYHVVGWFAAFACLVFGTGTAEARALREEAWELILGEPRGRKGAGAKKRRGHKKSRRIRSDHAHARFHRLPARYRRQAADGVTKKLMDLLAELPLKSRAELTAREELVERITKNAVRMRYPAYLRQGMQIGSGPMESMHKSGSQQRLKLPGARFTATTSQALLNLRMLELSGRWAEFWERRDLIQHLTRAFARPAAGRGQPVEDQEETRHAGIIAEAA